MTAVTREPKAQNNNRLFMESLTENMTKSLDQMQGLLPNQELPFNPVSGKRFKGANLIALAARNMPDNRWMTFGQIAAAGGYVNKGEKAAQIQIWKRHETGPNGERIEYQNPKLAYAYVFNIAQTTLANINTRSEPRFMPEPFINSFGIRHDTGPTARPAYDRDADLIFLPPPSRFPSLLDYQKAAVEQIVERQETRYANSPPPIPGTPQAAEREMRLKFAAAMIGDNLGIGHASDANNTVYTDRWKRLIANHPFEVTRNAAAAETLTYAVMQQGQKIERSQYNLTEDRTNALTGSQPTEMRIPGIDQPLYLGEATNIGMDRTARNADNADIERMTAKAYDVEGNVWQVRWSEIHPINENGQRTGADAIRFHEPTAELIVNAQDLPESAQTRNFIEAVAANPTETVMSGDMASQALFLDTKTVVGNNNDIANEGIAYDRAGYAYQVEIDADYRITSARETGLNVFTANISNGLDYRPTSLNPHNTAEVKFLNNEIMKLRREIHQITQDHRDELQYLAKQDDQARFSSGNDRYAVNIHSNYRESATDLGRRVEFQAYRIKSENNVATREPTTIKVLLTPGETFKNEGGELNGKVEEIKHSGRQLYETRARNNQTDKLMNEIGQKEFQIAQIRRRRNPQTTEQIPDAPERPLPERINLNVPYVEREKAKECGAHWDREQKTWYAPAGADANKFAQWRENRQIAATTPREELANAMAAKGLVLSGEHPIMDGKSHRIEAVGDDSGKGEKSGFYVAHGDGVPAGYLKNHRTGEEMRWKAVGYTLSDEQKNTLAKIAREKYQLRDEKTTKRQEQVAKKLTASLDKLEPVAERTAYMQAKGIDAEQGIFQTRDKDGRIKLLVPLTDIDGKVWSMATIGAEGEKSYAKDGKKQGNFHVVGGIEKLKDAPAIVLAEGYATAVTLKNGLGTPVVAAMDSGNLSPVAREMRKAFPEKAIVICGDDDKNLVNNPKIGKNIGKEKALEAARAVGGNAVFPIFPKGADNRLSDFNDLATKTDLGLEGLKQQTQPAIARAITNAKTQIANTLIAQSISEKKAEAREALEGKEKDLKTEKEKVRSKARENDNATETARTGAAKKAEEKEKGKGRGRGLSL
jgi:phage/plasmid primase-like uncharacterized protein/antirestriction protein ArdC